MIILADGDRPAPTRAIAHRLSHGGADVRPVMVLRLDPEAGDVDIRRLLARPALKSSADFRVRHRRAEARDQLALPNSSLSPRVSAAHWSPSPRRLSADGVALLKVIPTVLRRDCLHHARDLGRRSRRGCWGPSELPRRGMGWSAGSGGCGWARQARSLVVVHHQEQSGNPRLGGDKAWRFLFRFGAPSQPSQLATHIERGAGYSATTFGGFRRDGRRERSAKGSYDSGGGSPLARGIPVDRRTRAPDVSCRRLQASQRLHDASNLCGGRRRDVPRSAALPSGGMSCFVETRGRLLTTRLRLAVLVHLTRNKAGTRESAGTVLRSIVPISRRAVGRC